MCKTAQPYLSTLSEQVSLTRFIDTIKTFTSQKNCFYTGSVIHFKDVQGIAVIAMDRIGPDRASDQPALPVPTF